MRWRDIAYAVVMAVLGAVAFTTIRPTRSWIVALVGCGKHTTLAINDRHADSLAIATQHVFVTIGSALVTPSRRKALLPGTPADIPSRLGFLVPLKMIFEAASPKRPRSSFTRSSPSSTGPAISCSQKSKPRLRPRFNSRPRVRRRLPVQSRPHQRL
jgi:hypothetical protein